MKCIKTNYRNKILKVVFSGYLEAKNLLEVQIKILDSLKKTPEKIVVEMAKYEKIDFAFIQMLLVFKNEMAKKNLELELNLIFTEEDTTLLTRLNIINLLKTKSAKK